MKPRTVDFLLTLLVTLSPCHPVTLSAEAAETTPVLRWPVKQAEPQVFDGTQFHALAPAPVSINGPFSLSVWVNAGDLGGGNPEYGRGIARSTRGDQVGDWLLSVHRDGRVRFCNWRRPGADADGSHLSRNPLIVADTWAHIVATWDGKTTCLFVNGVEAACTRGNTASGWQTGHEVGRCWTDLTYHWDGMIDDLRVYRRTLTAAEIQQSAMTPPRAPETQLPEKPAGDPKVSQAIDRLILAKLQQHKLSPAPPADDAEFHRRVMLDLAGRIPGVAETEAFLADKSADKRHRLIETQLAGREMPTAWATVLSGWLMPKEGRRDAKFLAYLRNGLARNRSWDRFARDMLVARPAGTEDEHATAFLRYRKTALADHSIARDVGRAFFGVDLRCAQCHDHPQIKTWTRERFYGLSAFFARSQEVAYISPRNEKLTGFAERATGELEYLADGGKKIARLMFLDGAVIPEPPLDRNAKPAATPPNAAPITPPFSRREALAKVALSPKSPYFKRAIVNRIWQRLMGRGLVEPVDMMHDDNAATHPQLLDLLADDFAEHGFDLRRLMAGIMQSETYARSSRWIGPGDPPGETFYAVAVLKPLDADQLALSLPLATGHFDGQLGTMTRAAARTRPLNPRVEILKEFESEAAEFEPTATQALFLLNGSYAQTHLIAGSNLGRTLTELKDDAALARRAYLSILSRLPSAEESALVAGHLRERGEKSRQEACRDLIWALMSGSEFRFNH
jgi:hypothetical protein